MHGTIPAKLGTRSFDGEAVVVFVLAPPEFTPCRGRRCEGAKHALWTLPPGCLGPRAICCQNRRLLWRASFGLLSKNHSIKRSATALLLFCEVLARNLFRMQPGWTGRFSRWYGVPSSFSGSYPPTLWKRKSSHFVGRGKINLAENLPCPAGRMMVWSVHHRRQDRFQYGQGTMDDGIDKVTAAGADCRWLGRVEIPVRSLEEEQPGSYGWRFLLLFCCLF
ncbi:hypothetical protein B0T14DRAFT_269961 [Immersiella caudata]|uniref:Uncharacterized protein n=1 Tax=Immersiella caudata TaxID=314043 RepID=A0AA39WL61_9PEZI|nr:hypothetical protein B0T14DRAFT_269961 [Immersiella caudata]